MEKKINIAGLLKDCPKGMELDCTMFYNVRFDHVDANCGFPIVVTICEENNLNNLTKYGEWIGNDMAKCVIFPKGKTTWEGFVPPCQFKDGDIIVHTQNDRFVMSVYHKRIAGYIIKTHCVLWDRDEGLSVNKEICCYNDSVRFATEEEKQKLFDAIKVNGYKWNPETKTLEKLPKFKVGDRVKSNGSDRHYIIKDIKLDRYVLSNNKFLKFTDEHDFELVTDNFDFNTVRPFDKEWDRIKSVMSSNNKFDITTLKPFDKVLVRLTNHCVWKPKFFSYYNSNSTLYPFTITDDLGYPQCIPYEKNEYLLGTTNDCDDYYKTWQL